MIIYEPCNYVSNVAYYHSATRVCDYPDWSSDTLHQVALKRSFATLAMGSAFWHGSHTQVGNSFDNNLIAVIAYIAHQISVVNLPTNSSIITELSPTPRARSSVEISEDLVKMFYEKPVPQWAKVLDTTDLPHQYEMTFAGLLSTAFGLMLPWSVTVYAITKLAYALIDDDQADFITN